MNDNEKWIHATTKRHKWFINNRGKQNNLTKKQNVHREALQGKKTIKGILEQQQRYIKLAKKIQNVYKVVQDNQQLPIHEFTEPKAERPVQQKCLTCCCLTNSTQLVKYESEEHVILEEQDHKGPVAPDTAMLDFFVLLSAWFN